MLNTKYKEAAVDVLNILNHMEEEDIRMVPYELIDFLQKNASKEYKSHIDFSKKVVDMNLSEEAQNILGFIYRYYWCPEEKRAVVEKKLEDNELELQRIIKEKYDSAEIFKPVSKVYKGKKISNLPAIRKESLIKKIINKILSIIKVGGRYYRAKKEN